MHGGSWRWLVPIGEPSKMDDGSFEMRDDKGKVSRWQIGSSSLTVLEQIYQMDPFPVLSSGCESVGIWKFGLVCGRARAQDRPTKPWPRWFPSTWARR